MSNNVLKIELYGTVNISFYGSDITDQLSKKSIGMIAYLLCTPYQQASKDTIRELFWIDAGEKAAYNLRFNLWNIKKLIPDIDGESFILTQGGMCRINPQYPMETCVLDKIQNSQTEISEEELIEVTKLEGSLTFMEHFYLKDCDDFNDWLVLERSSQERKVINLLGKAADHLEEKDELEETVAVLKKMVYLSPFEDDFHIRLMKIHEKIGNFGEAVREYRKYSEWLKKELGVAPSKKLKETYLYIAQQAAMDTDGAIHVKDKVYNSDFAAAAEMVRGIFPDSKLSVTVQIDNWNGLDQKSKELFEALVKEKIITIGR